MSRRTFAAKYPGTCPACGGPIDEGDALTYDDNDRVVHADAECMAGVLDLITAGLDRRVPLNVCELCHLTRPCDCGDAA